MSGGITEHVTIIMTEPTLSPTHLLTVLTPDRRGIIAGITDNLDQADVRLLEMSQTVVREYFTILMVLALPENASADPLAAAIEKQLGTGAAVTLLPYKHGINVAVEAGERYILTARGADNRGTIQTLTALIAERGGNFTDLSCRAQNGQMTIVAEIDLPAKVALDQLQIDLEHAGTEAGLQVRLQHQRLFQATNEVAFRRTNP